MLNDLINEYTRVRISSEMASKDGTVEVTKILNRIEDFLFKNKWKCDPSSIQNKTMAMCAFFDMFARNIGGDTSAMMCYYFSTLVSKDLSISQNGRLQGNKYRAFMIFKNMDKWDRIIMMARLAPINDYKGHLDDNSFFDILLLGDVYKAWDVDPSSKMLQKLKNQAPIVARNHPNFTRQQVIVESELAHEAVFDIIETLVTNCF